MWFRDAMVSVCTKELGDVIAEHVKQSAYFVDFLRCHQPFKVVYKYLTKFYLFHQFYLINILQLLVADFCFVFKAPSVGLR